METFLKEVARKLLAQHPNGLEKVMVVFNNRRSGLYLRKQFGEIAEQQNSTFFLPQIMGIDDLISQLGRLEIIPSEFLLFELFDIHKKLNTENRKFDTFEEFISFGEMMLSDFSEIDQYCVDAEALFGNIYDLKDMESWDISGEKPTEFQKKYLEFYKSLFQYYSQLHVRLEEQHKAYNGMAYRHVAEHIDSMISKLDYEHIYFVGFNALSECERKIINHCARLGLGSMITDGDSYYYDDPNQEAGHFLRKHKDDGNEKIAYTEHFAEEKKISIVACPENVLQTKYAGHLLADDQGQVSAQNTAIVLSDESLLPAMLNALPPHIKSANVTMGFPFTNSTVHTLVLKLFSLYTRKNGIRYYHADILDTLSDYLICKLHGTRNLRAKIRRFQLKNHTITSSRDEIQEMAAELNLDLHLIDFIFVEEEMTPDKFLEILKRLLIVLHDTEQLNTNIKEKEALGCLLQIVNYLEEIQKKYAYVKEIKTLLKIYTRLAQRRSIDFYGEPLSGLQILGVLESRNLDFERVIMISTNEGLLPSGRKDNSLIPLSLKRHFKMPTYSEKDAVYAYHFYRFIQRAKEVVLLYNTETEATGKGEPSRFLMQVKEELVPRYSKNIELTEMVLDVDSKPLDTKLVERAEKDESVMLKLRHMAQSGFSPSALNKYNACPLNFYFHYVMGMKDEDELNDELNAAGLGTLVHEVLQDIYSLDGDKRIRIETLRSARNEIKERVDKKFEACIRNGQITEGKNRFLNSVAVVQITSLIDKEIEYLSQPGNTITIEQLEEDLLCPIDDGINISGKADRIDRTQGKLRIIDYKTGKVAPEDLKCKKGNGIPEKLFQVMTYAWLYYKKHGYSIPVVAGIQPLQMIEKSFMAATWMDKEELTDNDLEGFEQELKQVVTELMDSETPFMANEDSEVCKYCVMKASCKVGINKKN